MPDLFFEWGFWYLVGAAVVVVAAALLVTILLVARGIEREATRALEACREIEENTRAIWDLADARDTLEEIRGHVDAIEELTGHLSGVLQGGPRAEEVER